MCVVELVNIREMCNLLPNSQSSAVSPVPGGKEWLQTSWVPRGLTQPRRDPLRPRRRPTADGARDRPEVAHP